VRVAGVYYKTLIYLPVSKFSMRALFHLCGALQRALSYLASPRFKGGLQAHSACMLIRFPIPDSKGAALKSGWLRLIVSLVFFGGVAFAGVNFDRMLQLADQRYGTPGVAAVNAWRDLLTQTDAQPDAVKLRRVNDFFNRRIRFGEDTLIWGEPDYWATPLESLGRAKGDCEDYAIAKYVTLKLLGVPSEKMRLTYVRARIGGPQSTVVQAHMVLGYYPAPGDEPLVLDNLISDIRPASRRPDLTTVFGFNTEGLWVGGAGAPAASATQRLSKWQSLLARMKEEGID
jgi:predicted transglutaminase-like cysteine proteinase